MLNIAYFLAFSKKICQNLYFGQEIRKNMYPQNGPLLLRAEKVALLPFKN